MARYRKVDVRVWGDEKFRRLTPLQPSGQALWLYLITNPSTTNVPGIYRAGEAALSEELGWTLEPFREAFREVFREGLAEADWKARVVWLPGAAKYHRPENPNVVKSWGSTWDEIPECQLKDKAFHHLKAFTKGLGEGFGEAFLEACRQPLAKSMANQEQEQEQEQKGDLARAPDPSAPEPEHHPPARPTGYDLQRLFGRIRSEVFPTKLPWSIPPDKDGRTTTFAARLSDADITDTPATMRLALEHIRDGVEGWDHPGLSGPAFAFGSWRSKCTELREELAGLVPVPLRPRNTNGGGVEYPEFK